MIRLVAFLIVAAVPLAAQDFTTLKGHGGPVMGLAVAPSGQVATASFDNSIGLWTGREARWLEGHEAAVTVVAFTTQGVPVSGGDDFAVRLWDDQPRELGRHKGKITTLAPSPDGMKLASGSWDGSIRLWSMVGRENTELPPPGAGVNALVYDSNGRLFASTSKGALLRYDTDRSVPFPLVKHGFGVNTLALGDGWIAYGAVDGVTRVVNVDDGSPIADFTLERRPILAMSYHPETARLAVGDGQGYIMVIDTSRWSITRDFRAAREGPVWALAFSPDGQTIYAGGLDDVAYAWPVSLLDQFSPGIDGQRSFLRDAGSMPNGERQFMRKCSICHALEQGPSRKAGPSLHGLFGRRAGTAEGYRYSPILQDSDIIWDESSVDALFDEGPDHYIPGSKMPMQVISAEQDRADLIGFLKDATRQKVKEGE